MASYVVSLRYEDLPQPVIEKAKLCTLDALGCVLAGSTDRVPRIVAGHVAKRGTPGLASVIGHGRTAAPAFAALANGTAAHVVEWDDGHRPSGDHLGSAIVPAAIAVAQGLGSSGRQLLHSVVIGYDVMGRIGESVALPRGPDRFFHGNGTNGGFGVAAAAGKLLGLSEDRVASALGIAGDMASGLREFRPTGTDVKSLHVGRAGFTGITAADLASDGLDGSLTIFEGRNGYCAAVSPEPRPQLICSDLGERFAVIESGFKVFPCLGTLQLPVEAALALRSQHRIDPRAIDRIRIGLPEWGRQKYGGSIEDQQRHPKTIGNARFSMSFTVAAALSDGELTPRQFTTAKLIDPLIVGLERKVEFVTDAEAEKLFGAQRPDEPFFFMPIALEVDAGGRTLRHTVRSPAGYDPQRRGLTEAQVISKFRGIAGEMLPQANVDALIDWAMTLDNGSSAVDLAPLLLGVPRQ